MIRSLLLAVLVLLPYGLLAQDKAPLTAETLWQLKRLSSPAVSPDGRHTALAVGSADREKDTISTRIWLIDNQSGAARVLSAEGVNSSNPQFSPDGSQLLFESKREGDEAAQLYVLPLGGGEARRLTSLPTGASGARWFPDGKQVAFLTRIWTDLDDWDAQAKRLKERKDSKVSARTWDRAPLRHWDRWLDDREVHLYRIALAGGEPQPITRGSGVSLPPQDPGAGSYDIAPDGREVALVINSDTSGVQPNTDIVLLSLDSGEAFNTTANNPAPDFAPSYSPDGRTLAFSSRSIPGFYADRAVLMLFDRESGVRKPLTVDWDRSIAAPLWAPDSRSLLVSVDDAGTQRLYRVAVASGKASAITRETSYGSIAQSRDGKVLVALNDSFVQPPTLVRVDPRSGRHEQLSRFNDELLAGVAMGRYESVTYAGANGAPVQMWVVYPPGFDSGMQYPLYLLLHGGPHNGISNAWTWRWNAQIFAGWGYVTGWHNFHGSSGFGQDFADSITKDWATLPYADTIKAAEWFAAQPYIDARRMAAGGGSYGGYLATLILGREHPFKTLVAHAAVYNHYTQYGSDYGASKRRHGEFWEQPEQFRSTSPHYAAGNFTTPTLVIHGDLDYRVPVSHGIELFNTLQNRGVRSRFVNYPDENHWILKQNNSIHWYREKQTWLAEFLGGRPPE